MKCPKCGQSFLVAQATPAADAPPALIKAAAPVAKRLPQTPPMTSEPTAGPLLPTSAAAFPQVGAFPNPASSTTPKFPLATGVTSVAAVSGGGSAARKTKKKYPTWLLAIILIASAAAGFFAFNLDLLPLPAALGGRGYPSDYAFREALSAKERLSVEDALWKAGAKASRSSTQSSGGKRYSVFVAGRDAISGFGGRGFESFNEAQASAGGFSMPLSKTFSAQPEISCYRDGKLLGIWNFETLKMRAAKPGEAPEIFPAELLP